MRPAVPGALLLALAAALVPEATEVVVERRLGLMGTTLEIAVTASDRATALAASERAVAALEAAEARLSTWRDDTELARFNRAPAGEPFPLSGALAADLAAARACWQKTGGAFDPAIAPLVRAWGLRTGGRIPANAERRAALAASGMDLIELGQGAAVRRHEGVSIEEGGFGKGAGLRDALATLDAAPGVTSARLDLGGQLATTRRSTVALADPRHRDRPVVEEPTIDGGSVSTSGNGERGLVVDGRPVGHLLDPRTGAPSADVGSVTVWTADALRADCLSTGLFVMGPERAMAWAAARPRFEPDIEVVALVPRGERLVALASPGLAGRLAPLAHWVEIEIRRERTVTER